MGQTFNGKRHEMMGRPRIAFLVRGINLKWNYDKRTVRLSMDGYVKQTAQNIPCHAPSRYDLPKYGARIQYAKVDETVPLRAGQINFIQRAV